MKILFVLLFCCAADVLCFDMIVGDTVHKKMVFHERVKTSAIPFRKRIAYLSYVDEDRRTITGIKVLDADFSHATANITSGGIGFHRVTIRMKSQRSYPINYQVEIYV